jgi:hypothetical protein
MVLRAFVIGLLGSLPILGSGCPCGSLSAEQPANARPAAKADIDRQLVYNVEGLT